jgi:hypothetical protein
MTLKEIKAKYPNGHIVHIPNGDDVWIFSRSVLNFTGVMVIFGFDAKGGLSSVNLSFEPRKCSDKDKFLSDLGKLNENINKKYGTKSQDIPNNGGRLWHLPKGDTVALSLSQKDVNCSIVVLHQNIDPSKPSSEGL